MIKFAVSYQSAELFSRRAWEKHLRRDLLSKNPPAGATEVLSFGCDEWPVSEHNTLEEATAAANDFFRRNFEDEVEIYSSVNNVGCVWVEPKEYDEAGVFVEAGDPIYFIETMIIPEKEEEE